MKKVPLTDEYCSPVVYFDFAKDFPQLGVDYIEEGGYTDADAEAEWDEHIRSIIAADPQECNESDYEYIEGLIKAWGL